MTEILKKIMHSHYCIGTRESRTHLSMLLQLTYSKDMGNIEDMSLDMKVIYPVINMVVR